MAASPPRDLESGRTQLEVEDPNAATKNDEPQTSKGYKLHPSVYIMYVLNQSKELGLF